MIKLLKWIIPLGLVLIFVLALSYWRTRDHFFQWKSDLLHSQSPINKKQQIDDILTTFPSIPYAKLDKNYVESTKSNTKKYKPLLKDKVYFEIGRNDFYKKIVGHFRIKDMLPKDQYYKDCIFRKGEKVYWLIHPKLLYKLLELQDVLRSEDYDPDAFSIVNGHRHPAYNEKVSGASLSRHIKGEAFDLHIGDIDKNGSYQKKDKEIVLDILENKVIRSEGGIGRYPNSRAVHFDVRGHRARWDKM